MCVSPPLPSSADLLPLLFPFCSVPKAFWQGSDFCAHSSVLKEKGEKQKGCRRRGEGWWRGGSPGARPGPAGARGLVPRGRPCPQDPGLGGLFLLGVLCPPLLRATLLAAVGGRTGKARFLPPPPQSGLGTQEDPNSLFVVLRCRDLHRVMLFGIPIVPWACGKNSAFRPFLG